MANNRYLLWRISSYRSREKVRPSIYLLASLCPRKDDGVVSFSFQDWELWDLAANGRGRLLFHLKQRENDFSCVSLPSRSILCPFSVSMIPLSHFTDSDTTSCRNTLKATPKSKILHPDLGLPQPSHVDLWNEPPQLPFLSWDTRLWFSCRSQMFS